MRRPALVLVIGYSIAVLGMSLMPTVGEDGEITHLTIFQSFYWLSYTATTIGYGEVPVEFSDWQRVWVAFSIYYTVPAWLYAAGKIIALLSDPVFQHAIRENSFARRVRNMRTRFVVVCGFGESGHRIVKRLLHSGYECVVIDNDSDRINRMSLDPVLHNVLAVSGDAADVELLTRAGIGSPFCRAVIAITDNEDVNIKVALSARLLSSNREKFQIICRTMTREGSANAKSFNTDLVINTHHIFAERLTTGLRRPAIADLMSRFYSEPGTYHEPPPQPPAGSWIICGYGALGRTLERFLEYEGVDAVIIDDQIAVDKGHVQGKGTEAVTLREARIDHAQAIVAGRDYDPDNLSIAMTAKAMQPSLFVVGRQNRSSNERLFEVAGFNRVMEEAELIVSEIFPHLARPLLGRFLRALRHQNEMWGEQLLLQIEKLSGGYNPHHYVLRITEKHAPAIIEHLKSGHLLRLQSLWTQPDNPDTFKQALPLLLLKEDKEILLPNPATNLQVGDQVLIAYQEPYVASRLSRNCFDEASLYWALHGREKTTSYVLNYLLKKFE